MDPLVEIRPGACLFVLGPQLQQTTSRSPSDQQLSYPSLLRSALSCLQSSGQGLGVPGMKSRSEGEFLRMQAVDAMQELLSMLRTRGLYRQWLEETLLQQASDEEAAATHPGTSVLPDCVQWLLELQSRGAMLACTHYGTALDNACGRRPATVSHKDPAFEAWLGCSGNGGGGGSNRRTPSKRVEVKSGRGGAREEEEEEEEEEGEEETNKRRPLGSRDVGFLHLHGVQTSPESICLLPYAESPSAAAAVGKRGGRGQESRHSKSHMSGEALSSLQELFHTKLVFLVGFDGEEGEDPLLPSLLQLLYPERDSRLLKNPPILLTTSHRCGPSQLHPLKLLQLQISSADGLRDIVVPGAAKNFTVGKEHTDKHSDGVKVQAFLLFNEKQSFRKLGEIIYQQSKSGEIYVRRDALTVIFDNSSILYGNLVTYGGNGLRKLWDLVFSDSSTLLGKGLIAVGLQSAAIIWINNKPKGLGNITGINSVHTFAAHQAVHNMAMAQKPHPSPSSTISSAPQTSSPPISQPRPPPYFTPISRVPPAVQSAAGVAYSSPSPSPSSAQSAVRGTEAMTTVTATSSNGVGVASRMVSPPLPFAVNPLSCMLLPGAAGGMVVGGATPAGGVVVGGAAHGGGVVVGGAAHGGSVVVGGSNLAGGVVMGGAAPAGGVVVGGASPVGGVMVTPQYAVALPPPVPPPSLATTVQPAVPNPFPVPILPASISALLSSAPHSRLLTQAATTPHIPVPSTTPTSSIRPPRQGDLELLTQIQNRISTHLNSMSSDEEGGERPLLVVGGVQGSEVSSGGEEHLCSPSSVQLCVARPAEVLRHTHVYEQSLHRVLQQSECVVRRYENSHFRPTPPSSSHSSSSARHGPTTGLRTTPTPAAVATASSHSDTATRLKFSTMSPQLSLTGAASSPPDPPPPPPSLPKTTPLSLPGATPPPLLVAAPTSSLLGTIPPSSTAKSATPLVAQSLGMHQYQSLLPLLYTPMAATPMAAGIHALSRPALAMPGYYLLPAVPGMAGPTPLGLPLAAMSPQIATGAVQNGSYIQLPSAGSGVVVPATTHASSATPLCVVLPQPPVLTTPTICLAGATPLLPQALVTTAGAASQLASVGVDKRLRSGEQEVSRTVTAAVATPSPRKRASGVAPMVDPKVPRLAVAPPPSGALPLSLRGPGGPGHSSSSSSSSSDSPIPIPHSRVKTETEAVGSASSGKGSESAGSGTQQQQQLQTSSSSSSDSAERTHLWQFLLDLLLTPNHGSLIQWTGRESEFNIVDFPGVADLWRTHCRDLAGGVGLLSEFASSLEACCSHRLLERVAGGGAATFRFLINIQRYIIEHSSILPNVQL